MVLGPSGAGKTTLLETIVGSLAPRKGRITLGGRALFDGASGVNIPTRNRRVGLVFQDASLFPHLDARANVAFGAKGPSANSSVDRWLERVGAGTLARRRPRDLSGGERQRVALARALAAEPDALLLDEPFNSLDRRAREEMGALLVELAKERPIPFVLVTHDPGEALRLGERMIVLEAGRVVAAGDSRALLAAGGPAAAHAGSANWLRGTVLTDGPDGARVDLDGTIVATLPLGKPAGATVVLVLAAEEPILAKEPVRTTSARNVLAGTVTSIVDAQDAVDVIVATPVPMRVRLTRAAARELALQPGIAVWVLIKATALRAAG